MSQSGVLLSEEEVSHRPVGESRWHDADEKEADNTDTRHSHPHLLARKACGVLAIFVPAEVTHGTGCSKEVGWMVGWVVRWMVNS